MRLLTTINAVWAYLLVSTGRKARSPALVADGMHIYTDVITSVGVIAALFLSLVTGWTVIDPLMAIVVAINILWQGWRVISGSVQGLMDGALSSAEIDAIRAQITAHAGGAIEFHDLKTREAGPARFAEFHLVVPRGMSVSDAHDICDRIESGTEKADARHFSADPCRTGKQSQTRWFRRLERSVAHFALHAIRCPFNEFANQYAILIDRGGKGDCFPPERA